MFSYMPTCVGPDEGTYKVTVFSTFFYSLVYSSPNADAPLTKLGVYWQGDDLG